MHLGEGTGNDFLFITSNITFSTSPGMAWLYFYVNMPRYLGILFLLEFSVTVFRL